MEIVNINPNRIEKKKIEYIVKILKKGKAVVLPTDTSYGLAVNATDKKAVDRLYRIKKRSRRSPLTVFIRNLSQIRKYAIIDKRTKLLYKQYFPGPLSIIVLKKNNLLPRLIISKNDIGFRIPNNKLAIKILKNINFPITGTSANISGGKEPYTTEEILKQYRFKKLKPDLIINVGKLKKIKPSTIIDLTGEKVKLVRKGPIKHKDIIKTLKLK